MIDFSQATLLLSCTTHTMSWWPVTAVSVAPRHDASPAGILSSPDSSPSSNWLPPVMVARSIFWLHIQYNTIQCYASVQLNFHGLKTVKVWGRSIKCYSKRALYTGHNIQKNRPQGSTCPPMWVAANLWPTFKQTNRRTQHKKWKQEYYSYWPFLFVFRVESSLE